MHREHADAAAEVRRLLSLRSHCGAETAKQLIRTLSWCPGTRTLRKCCLTRSSSISSAIAPARQRLTGRRRYHLCTIAASRD